ncbi:hypothetical protein FOC1_g10012480 [Fusarium oxysporum f. sp. cubense race 1]|uniref:Uncharacterized protein n=1 Tax=Fusarium oxysporum f. sp. cubense (strain race 1) TaxID=1229664 RepID=N4UKL4_FUSC1|nr:hypothetical protein FOC1_g10012480 [Fusarium oxysporum f. sp. cubense race 1]
MNTPNRAAVVHPQYDAQSTQQLLALVQHLQVTSRTMAKQTPASGQKDSTIVTDIGDYLIQAAQAWAQMTDALVESRQVQQAVVDAHEQAMVNNHLSDLSTVVSMDVDLTKLSKIRDLTAQFSRDVHQVWQNDAPCPGKSP